MRRDWLAVVNIMAAECTDASCVDYTNYTSPFYLYIIHDCTRTDFGRLRFRLQAIKQITAAATSSSSAESAVSAILLSNKMLSCVTQILCLRLYLPVCIDLCTSIVRQSTLLTFITLRRLASFIIADNL